MSEERDQERSDVLSPQEAAGEAEMQTREGSDDAPRDGDAASPGNGRGNGRRGGRRGSRRRGGRGPGEERPPQSVELDESGDVDGNRADVEPDGYRRGQDNPGRPLWQEFGVPPSYWAHDPAKQQRPRPGGNPAGRRTGRRPPRFLECRTCGIKMERKASHGSGKVNCPMCGRRMSSR